MVKLTTFQETTKCLTAGSHFKSDCFILDEYKETFLTVLQFFKAVYSTVKYSRQQDLFSGLNLPTLIHSEACAFLASCLSQTMRVLYGNQKSEFNHGHLSMPEL